MTTRIATIELLLPDHGYRSPSERYQGADLLARQQKVPSEINFLSARSDNWSVLRISGLI